MLSQAQVILIALLSYWVTELLSL